MVDNGEAPLALPQLDLPVTVQRQAPGLTASRNTIMRRFRDGGFTHLVFLDDDQVPRTGWLNGLLTASAAHPGAVIAGIVDYLSPMDSEDPALRDIMARWTAGRTPGVLDGVGAGNTLIPRALIEAAGWPMFEQRFDAGGEDTALFGILEDHGATFWCTADATVDELFDASRLNRAWFVRREMVNGRTMGMLQLGDRGPLDLARLVVDGTLRTAAGAGLGLARSARHRHVWPQDFNTMWGGLGRLQALRR